MADCCNHFSFTDDGDSFETWQGLRGPYFIPHLSADGVLSWTNTGNLPNPAPVDISGPPGASVQLRGPVPSVEDLPDTAPSGELWLVGSASPYDGWFYNGASWENAGQIAVGPQGPTGTTPDLQIGTVETGAPGSAAEASITGTPEEPRLNLTLPRGQQGPAVPLSDDAPLMDGTASAGTGTSAARSDHRHPTDTSRASAAELATYTRPNLLDNWYFVGGGSQIGYGMFPVNQRGQASYFGGRESGVIGIDRWLASGSLTLNSDSVNWSSGQVRGYPQFRQYLGPLCAGTYTVTLLAKVNSVGGKVRFCVRKDNVVKESINFQSATSGYEVFTFSFTLTASETGYSIGLVVYEESTNYIDIDIKAIKLELGNTQTLAHQENGGWVLNEVPDYAEELAICQAYYLHHVGYASVGFLADTGSAYVNIVTPSTMAKTPTLEVVQYNNLIHGTTIEPITRASVSELRKNAVTVEVGIATTGVFELCMTADFMVNLSAE